MFYYSTSLARHNAPLVRRSRRRDEAQRVSEYACGRLSWQSPTYQSDSRSPRSRALRLPFLCGTATRPRNLCGRKRSRCPSPRFVAGRL